MMCVYALFNNEVKKILIERWEPGDKRSELIPCGISDKQMINSAEKGFQSIYSLLKRTENICISYEIEDTADSVCGASAGLAFALALLVELTGNDMQIAATGVLSSATRDSKIVPVNYIPEQLYMALQKLPGDARTSLFYPAANDGEIGDNLKKSLENRGVFMKPIHKLADAATFLMRPEKEGSFIERLLSNYEDQRIKALTEIVKDQKIECLNSAARLMLNDPSDKVRERAAWALDMLNDARALPALLKAIHDHCWSVRSNAGWALVHLGEMVRTEVENIYKNSPRSEAGEMACLVLKNLDRS